MRARTVPLFAELPQGFVYQPDFVSPSEEIQLLERIAPLEFSEVRMRGVVARRRVRQFGWHYSFDSYRLTEAVPIPEFLLALRERAASFARVHPDELVEALVTEYQPGATIGWHRDAPTFGIVVGVSLRSACIFKLRPYANHDGPIAIELAPRSAYLLDGPVRREWQHSIPATKSLRYSVTFRTLDSRRNSR